MSKKEVLKKIIKRSHFIYNNLRKIYHFYSNIKLKYFSGSNKDIFTEIYIKNKWGDQKSFSGTGSNMEQTQNILNELPNVIKKYKIKSILDIPCGDFYWMKEHNFKNVNYIGADIVSDLIKKNNYHFGTKNIKFKTLDIINNDLPNFDLLFCRDCLVHLSFNDIFNALRNIKRAKFKYLMMTNFLERDSNVDIPTGSWRTINLCKPPFNFPQPIENIYEKCTEGDNKFSDKVLSIWDFKNIPY
tara:strand:+ start:212 stop:940 length:729 start_codon:yes stop_codon:yes gene_type:complete